MTSLPAHEPPFYLDGSVTRDKLMELIGVETELKWLDLKRECDINKSEGKVEIAKDVGAMQIAGGYVLLGVDDDGTVTGLPVGHARYFDEATLRSKLDAYLGAGYDLRSKVHQVETDNGPVDVALVWVAPHPDGCNVFRATGNYANDKGEPKVAFRAGDVYARHGTKSEPWNQDDRAEVNARRDAAARDRWRAESTEEFARQLHAATTANSVTNDPSATYTWKLDADGFEAATVELIRRNDDVPLKRMLRSAQAEVRRIVSEPIGRVRDIANASTTGLGAAAADELTTVLDRFTTIAALALDLDRPRYFTMATQALAELYSWSTTDLRVQSSAHGLAPLLWLRMAERQYAVGGLAVRLKRWAQVRELVLLDVDGLDEFSVGRTWHRDALTQSSRAGLFDVVRTDGRPFEASLLQFATGVAFRLPVLRPDLPELDPRSPRDPVRVSICTFDLLAGIVASVQVDATTERHVFNVSYPNFARFEDNFDKPIAKLIADPQVRAELTGNVSDATLARVLALVDQVAQKEAQRYFGWDGYHDQVVKHFIDKHAAVPG
ncbi:AlbA family DNA-binding domain-containing protein [Nocardioides dongxiaopingii]|uniref:AlbA family DNA-binding domain-containing protein n=1 Tax=Nocardioides dongxiaopingii TaxID=2576036 RepID=UPI0010C7695D|nr:RNA-binding domain-containing protein [Nocardioides dongxiaopingii]